MQPDISSLAVLISEPRENRANHESGRREL